MLLHKKKNKKFKYQARWQQRNRMVCNAQPYLAKPKYHKYVIIYHSPFFGLRTQAAAALLCAFDTRCICVHIALRRSPYTPYAYRLNSQPTKITITRPPSNSPKKKLYIYIYIYHIHIYFLRVFADPVLHTATRHTHKYTNQLLEEWNINMNKPLTLK